jgi:multimeric flavodoxin WrbA
LRKLVKSDNSDVSTARVLGLVGSQRKLGNSELFIKEVSRNIPVQHHLRLVRLPSLDIRPCNGCYRCVDEGVCAIDDDVTFVAGEIARCDALIIAVPVYFLGAHSTMKALLDRAFSFFGILEKVQGKPCLLVSIYGMRNRIGTTPQTLLTFASFLGLAVRGSASLQAALPGDVLRNRNCLKTAVKLGSLLFGGRTPPRVRRSCPFCGNDIVRIHGAGFTCTLCHGSFELDEGGSPLKGKPGWDVTSADFVKAHREWLRGMKARFMSEKERRMASLFPYKDIGVWLEPE